MRRFFILLPALFAISAALSAATIEVKSATSRAILPCGTSGGFQVSVLDDQGNPIRTGTVECSFQDDHFQPISQTTVDLAERNPFTVSEKLHKPGFLRCDVKYQKQSAFAVIGYDPFKIETAQVQPPDFEKFWMDAKAEALKIPLDVKLEKLDRLSTASYTGYAINFANINGTRMYGYLSVPTAPGPHPAGIVIPGAGPGLKNAPADYPLSKTIVMSLNVHPYPVEPETMKERFKELNKDEYYYFHGLPDLKNYIFYRVILGICRGVKYLRERPDWDQKHLLITGGSQGGGLTIAATALNADVVSAAAVYVPAFCELVPGVRPPNNNWTKIRSRPEGVRITSYLDAINFAPMIRCPMIWSVGFLDVSCFPRTVFAAYNRLKITDKFIWIGPKMTHRFYAPFAEFRKLWLEQQLSK